MTEDDWRQAFRRPRRERIPRLPTEVDGYVPPSRDWIQQMVTYDEYYKKYYALRDERNRSAAQTNSSRVVSNENETIVIPSSASTSGANSGPIRRQLAVRGRWRGQSNPSNTRLRVTRIVAE